MSTFDINVSEIIEKFKELRIIYSEFTDIIEEHLRKTIKNNGIKDVFVKSRTKDLESFLEKLTRPGKKYSDPFSDITDFSGIRIIVYYSSQLKEVENLINEEFEIDQNKSVDKIKELHEISNQIKFDAFGYASVHKIVSINDLKKSDPKWSKYTGLFAEIQIRTSLQDAWATVSHNSQYKVESLIPSTLRRKMSMLAGLFELSDEQFLFIKAESEKIRLQYADKRLSGSNNIPIDSVSLVDFYNNSSIIISVMSYIRSLSTFKVGKDLLNQYSDSDNYLVTEECNRIGIFTIEELEAQLSKNEETFFDFLSNLSKDQIWRATNGFVLFLLIAKTYSDLFEVNYLIERYGWDYGFAYNIVKHLKK